MTESKLGSSCVQERFDDGVVFIVGGPVHGAHLRICRHEVSPRSVQDEAFDDLDSILVGVLLRSLCEVAAEANRQKRRELKFIMLVNERVLQSGKILRYAFNEKFYDFGVAIVGS